MGAKLIFEHFWQPERPLLVEYWTLVGGGGLLWATVVMSPWIICLINRLEHFTSLFYLHSGCWSDNLILLSIYHNCLRLKLWNNMRYKIYWPRPSPKIGKDWECCFHCLCSPYVSAPPPPQLFHLSVQWLASALETPGNLFGLSMSSCVAMRTVTI